MKQQTELPEKPKSGSVAVSSRGVKVTLQGTGKASECGERKFRVQYPARTAGQWHMPGCVGDGLFTRDELHAEGYRGEV